MDVDQDTTKDTSINDVLKYLVSFKDEMRMATDQMNKNLRVLDEKNKAIKLDIDDKGKQSAERFEVMERRLTRIEEGAKRLEYQRVKINKLRQMEKSLDDQPAGRIVTVEKLIPDQCNSTKSSYQSTWAREMEEVERDKEREKEIKEHAEKEREEEVSARMEKEKRGKVEEKNKRCTRQRKEEEKLKLEGK